MPSSESPNHVPREFKRGAVQLDHELSAHKLRKPLKQVSSGEFPDEKRETYLRLLWMEQRAFEITDPTSSQFIAFRRYQFENILMDVIIF